MILLIDVQKNTRCNVGRSGILKKNSGLFKELTVKSFFWRVEKLRNSETTKKVRCLNGEPTIRCSDSLLISEQ